MVARRGARFKGPSGRSARTSRSRAPAQTKVVAKLSDTGGGAIAATTFRYAVLRHGTCPGSGPVAIRIGPSMSGTPPTRDVYVIRHTVNGVVRYEGYVNGTLLTGQDALGNTVSASVPASSICWDTADSGAERGFVWFGETFNDGDSMGGWDGSTMDHLDYTSQRYTIGSGWSNPTWSYPADCYVTEPPTYLCRLSGADRMFVQTIR